jgi:alcohol dehydrogenase
MIEPDKHSRRCRTVGTAETIRNEGWNGSTDQLDDNRLDVAMRFGATAVVNSADGKAAETVMKMTSERGVDTAIEAVGLPATFELCAEIVAPGGTIANVGVHGKKVDLHLEHLWDRNITITTRLVDTVSTPMLLDVLRSRKIDPKLLITHRFKLDRLIDAYKTLRTPPTRECSR